MQEQKKDFDLATHVRDPKSGRVIRENPYRLVVSQVEGGGTKWLYERPVGSGMFYTSAGDLDMDASRSGIEKTKKIEAERSRTELEKAEADYAMAKAKVEQAKVSHQAEQLKKNAKPSQEGK